MIFSKPLGVCAVLGYLLSSAQAAYELNINGQTYQINVVNEDGQTYVDRRRFTDDYGQLLDEQKDAICSSLRYESCHQVTNNGAKTHNLFNYFPNHASESIVAHANDRYNKNESPYLLKQPMDDRTLQYLNRQNPHNLGTKNIHPKMTQNTANIAQSLFDSIGSEQTDPLKLVGSKKIKYKNKKKKKEKDMNGESVSNDQSVATEHDINGEEEEYSDVEVEFYSNLEGDTELADALGLDEDEFGETVDRIVAQLVASYLDNDSDEVDVSQIFANEISVENGDVSMEQINLDQGSMEEMSELLTSIAKKHKKKRNDDGSEMDEDTETDDAQIFAMKFVVDSDKNNDDGGDDIGDKLEDINNDNNVEEGDVF